MYNLNVFNRFGKNYSKEGDKTGKPQKFVHFSLWTVLLSSDMGLSTFFKGSISQRRLDPGMDTP